MTRPVGPGGKDKPAGFLSRLANSLTPPIITPDDDDPNAPVVRPRTVLAATVLAALAGAVLLFLGLSNLTNLDAVETQARAQYAKAVQTCTTEVGGVNASVGATPADADDKKKAMFESCRKLPAENDIVDNVRSQTKTLSIAVTICGLAAAVASVLLYRGSMWGRRLAVFIVVIMMMGTMLMRIQNLLLLGASLALVIAVVMCYLASGGAFFQRLQLRRKQA